MLAGYTRVSFADDRQWVDLQHDALAAAGVDARPVYADEASEDRDDRLKLKVCLALLRDGDTLVVWRLDRLGRSLPNLLSILADFKKRRIAFRSLSEQMDTTTPQGPALFSICGALEQYERMLARERIMVGQAVARRRGRQGGRPPAVDGETIAAITAALENGASKAAICRNFGVARSTLIGTLERIGWSASAAS